MNQNFAMYHKPTIIEKLWRALGYKYHLVDLPEEADGMDGWIMTHTRFNFDFFDRIRLLLTGKLYVDTRQATDVRVGKCISAASFRIAPPFDVE